MVRPASARTILAGTLVTFLTLPHLGDSHSSQISASIDGFTTLDTASTTASNTATALFDGTDGTFNLSQLRELVSDGGDCSSRQSNPLIQLCQSECTRFAIPRDLHVAAVSNATRLAQDYGPFIGGEALECVGLEIYTQTHAEDTDGSIEVKDAGSSANIDQILNLMHTLRPRSEFTGIYTVELDKGERAVVIAEKCKVNHTDLSSRGWEERLFVIVTMGWGLAHFILGVKDGMAESDRKTRATIERYKASFEKDEEDSAREAAAQQGREELLRKLREEAAYVRAAAQASATAQ